jgi:hypothetical protein
VLEGKALAVGRLGERLDGPAKAQLEEVHPGGVGVAQPEPAGLPEVAHRLRLEPQQLGATTSAVTASVLAMTKPASTACPPRGPVPIMAGWPAMTAKGIGKRLAMAAMNECMSSKKALARVCECRGWP